LLGNGRGHTSRHKEGWEEIIKYAFEMGSGAMVYILSFINIDPDIRRLSGDSQTQAEW
jgi:hypothetical protein